MVFPVSKFVGLPLFVKIYPTVRRERFGAMVASIFPPKKEPRRLRIEFPNQVADIYCWNMVKDHGFSKLNFAGSGSFLHQVWDGVWMVRWCFMAKMWNWLGLKILHSAFIYIYIYKWLGWRWLWCGLMTTTQATEWWGWRGSYSIQGPFFHSSHWSHCGPVLGVTFSAAVKHLSRAWRVCQDGLNAGWCSTIIISNYVIIDIIVQAGDHLRMPGPVKKHQEAGIPWHEECSTWEMILKGMAI